MTDSVLENSSLKVHQFTQPPQPSTDFTRPKHSKKGTSMPQSDTQAASMQLTLEMSKDPKIFEKY